ncbi:3-oxoacyl-ACP reductase [Streptomyces eurocidicus]|uniref:3-oxoacyl-ACP reductase n=1 Tax=Streptomyces eurocidicus TaxID=66423 RepID=A0A2N8NXY8_STREU|nr:SDR family oxidoreductase [Streptomyces eurocidicus]MBB5119734.1 3-oxoacyl-[acyl-carrier protein] reductase [Streptomyces eurocidicus]MBF6050757.1 SDR family oxidoreductase [Streptomyces eurocidicus]PNE33632.1 3-oxoacyl-ACP reductase [Streptomyces eurocidicus]
MSRSVFITGGNRGIGLAVARAMAADGDRVAVGHRSGEPPEGFFGVRCEVTDPESVAAAFAAVTAEQGPVDVLVANAGITRDTLLLRMDDAAFDEVLATNLQGVFRTVRAAAGGMLAARGGRIVLMSSALGFLGSPGQANYAATKTALVGFARSLAWELGSRGVTVNVVAPGIIETDMTKQLTDRRMKDVMRMTPLGRPGTAEEVAAAVRFLAGESASYVTGAVLPVGGGIGMGI